MSIVRKGTAAARWIGEAMRIRRTRAAMKTDLVELNIGLTWLCNSKCKGCGIWEIPFESPAMIHNELTLDEIRALFDGRGLDGLQRLVFPGGEPLLRPDLLEVVRHAVGRWPSIQISVVTNGLVRKTPEIARAILDAGATLHLSFSLDG